MLKPYNGAEIMFKNIRKKLTVFATHMVIWFAILCICKYALIIADITDVIIMAMVLSFAWSLGFQRLIDWSRK